MKKLIILLLITSASSWMVSASNVDLFKFDETKLEQVFSELNELEKVVMEHENLTLTELDANPILKAGLSHEAINLVETMGLGERPSDIPSFCWGGCLSVIGVSIVSLKTSDKKEVAKAWNGCFIGSTGYCIVAFYWLFFGTRLVY